MLWLWLEIREEIQSYNDFFKQGHEAKELSHSKIRPHLEWADGKWISKSKQWAMVLDI
ncbi:hypothetical protein NC652_001761 [Populus alba x Populus x berolinensis]|nr:hypothetical protein NC652_001761 [Populus alba x Populus x berolinensis]